MFGSQSLTAPFACFLTLHGRVPATGFEPVAARPAICSAAISVAAFRWERLQRFRDATPSAWLSVRYKIRSHTYRSDRYLGPVRVRTSPNTTDSPSPNSRPSVQSEAGACSWDGWPRSRGGASRRPAAVSWPVACARRAGSAEAVTGPFPVPLPSFTRSLSGRSLRIPSPPLSYGEPFASCRSGMFVASADYLKLRSKFLSQPGKRPPTRVQTPATNVTGNDDRHQPTRTGVLAMGSR